ncbi:MAG: response regulator, partial [Pseudomonadota bacterium]
AQLVPPPAAEAEETTGTADWRQGQVLCIEDNPANLRLIERILGQHRDIHLLSASAPGLGLALARTHHPALILLDINLPDMDGYAVMQCLRENQETRGIPVVAISANAMPMDLAQGMAAGFAEYLTKPIDVDKLLKTIDRFIPPKSMRRMQ